VLDNIPYAFVKPKNRFYLLFGMGAAPDDPEEFAAFVGELAKHLVGRYGLGVVSTWRFRLGTECDGPRIGPPWLNFTAPNPPFVYPDGNGRNYTTRKNGLDAYVATYLAVAKALKAVVPKVLLLVVLLLRESCCCCWSCCRCCSCWCSRCSCCSLVVLLLLTPRKRPASGRATWPAFRGAPTAAAPARRASGALVLLLLPQLLVLLLLPRSPLMLLLLLTLLLLLQPAATTSSNSPRA